MDASNISLDRLKAFLAVVEAGGFTAAAQRLRMGKNALSQQVAKLEKDLGVSLFTRTTRLVVPTDAGRQLHQACLPLLHELQTTLETLGETRLSGPLRITAPADYAESVLCPALAEFGRLHPQLRIELITDSRVLDLVAERVDLAVRLGWPRDSSLRAVKVGEFELAIVTAPTYAARTGTPQHPRDLAQHSWIALSVLRHPSSWRFVDQQGEQCSVRMRTHFSANTVEGMLALVRCGAGVSVATDFSIARDLQRGTLMRILADWRLPRAGIYLVWPSAPLESAKVRALVDFLRSWLAHRETVPYRLAQELAAQP